MGTPARMSSSPSIGVEGRLQRGSAAAPVQRPGPGTPVTVVGLARSGLAAARWLMGLGCAVRVTESGSSDALEKQARALQRCRVAVELGGHTRDFIWGAELVMASPGVAMDADPIRWAEEMQIPIVSELDLASWYCPGRIVAVTGSNGKSTVVTLLGEILKAAGREAVVCGNIGNPLSEFLDQIHPATVVVTEVSSFQLEGSLSFHPEVACILNVTPNHLDRHSSMDHYQRAKGRLLSYQNQESWAVLNADDPGAFGLAAQVQGRLAGFSRTQKVTGAYISQGQLFLSLPSHAGPICKRSEMSLRGRHHEENALAAASLAGILGVAPEVIGKVLTFFKGLRHRQQHIATIRGVTFINDSKSTTVDSGIRAIEAVSGRVVLIAGGRDKGGDFRRLKRLTRKLKAAVLLGEDSLKIAAGLNSSTRLHQAGDLNEAVCLAFSLAKTGESVLLSPMCTSFDMFQDFEERGERFVEAVRKLEG